MASLVKDKVKTATGRSGSIDDPEAKQEAEKYRLIVTAGGSYDTSKHAQVPVNTGEAVYIENDFVKAKVKVRIREYKGLPSRSPSSSPYFDSPKHTKDQYSIAFSFVPKQDIPSVNTVWGNDFDHPVRDRLPPGFNTAFKIVKEFIDPGLSCDAYADEPWLYGPSLSCWFAFRIGEKLEEGEDLPAPSEEDPMEDGADGSGMEVRQKLGIPDNNEKRRKFFLSASNRENVVFEKGRVYQADFYNPYIDFGNFSLKLPGFSLKVIKYVDQKSHCLRYVFKNKESGDVYVNVNLRLLWGEDLAKALEEEEKRPSTAGAREERAKNGEGGVEGEAGKVDGVVPRDERRGGPLDVEQKRKESNDESAKTLDSGSALAHNSREPSGKPSTADGRDQISDLLQATSTSDRRSLPDIQPSGRSSGSEISDLLQATSTSDRRSSGEAILDMKK